MLEHQTEDAASTVYFTSEITPEAMIAAYEALGVELSGENIAVKLSTGEPPASNYLDPELIAIAGVYRIIETRLDAQLRNKPVVVTLEDDTLRFDPLSS